MHTHIKPPSLFNLALEGRVFAEFGAYLLAQPWLRQLPRGDGHAVLLVPGFGTTDRSMKPLRRFLERLGYAAYGWEQGRNLGMKASVRDGLRERLKLIHAQSGGPVTLIGWSLGGVFVRELARSQPEKVRQVITLGSPINHQPDATNVDAIFRKLNPGFRHDLEAFARRSLPPPVPTTAIYSKTDGIVAWQTSRENDAPNTQNIEVFSSHFGLGVNPVVLKLIAQKLAHPTPAK